MTRTDGISAKDDSNGPNGAMAVYLLPEAEHVSTHTGINRNSDDMLLSLRKFYLDI